jgi:hypothetical protein
VVLYCAIDDTDNPNSRGTGRLAREIADEIDRIYPVLGVTRHQLCSDPAIPMTSQNSCAVIHIINGHAGVAGSVLALARRMLLEGMAEESDPGIAVATHSQASLPVIDFGRVAKHSVIEQEQARAVARDAGVILEGLGGTEDGVIGALAGIGLAASRNDGRYVQKAALRSLSGVQPVRALLESGIDRVLTTNGLPVHEGEIRLLKFPRPALVGGEAVLYVEQSGDQYTDVKIG